MGGDDKGHGSQTRAPIYTVSEGGSLSPHMADSEIGPFSKGGSTDGRQPRIGRDEVGKLFEKVTATYVGASTRLARKTVLASDGAGYGTCRGPWFPEVGWRWQSL